MRKIILIFLMVFVAIAIAGMLRYPGKASIKLQPEVCNAELWKHVYEKDRLRIIEKCTAVDGRVLSLSRAADGDLHIGLDPQQQSMLNLMNVIHGHRELVVEVICEHPPVKEPAKEACAGFRSNVTAPQIGDRIRVTGSYVTDRDWGWNEIHPTSKIEILQ